MLRYAAGATATAIARDLHITKHTVGKWRGRFVARRLDGLLDEPRPSVPRTNADAHVERALTATLESTPRNATHWSTRSLAQHCEVSQTAIAASGRRLRCSRIGFFSERWHRWFCLASSDRTGADPDNIRPPPVRRRERLAETFRDSGENGLRAPDVRQSTMRYRVLPVLGIIAGGLAYTLLPRDVFGPTMSRAAPQSPEPSRP